MKIRLYFFLLLISFGATQAGAQVSHTSEHAQRCAGIFALLSEANQSKPELHTQLDRITALFDDIYSHEIANASTTIHVHMQDEIRQEALSRAPELQEEGVLCGAWADTMMAQGDHYKFVAVFPKVIALTSRQNYQPLTQQLFTQPKP
jgi:hypothetical protein